MLHIWQNHTPPKRKKRGYYEWSIHEENLIKRLVGSIPMTEIASMLGRSYPSVRSKIAKMRGLGEIDRRIIKPWSDEEDSILRNEYDPEDVPGMVVRLGRTRDAVLNRVSILRRKDND